MVPTNTAPFLKFDDENARRCVRDVLDWEEWSRGQLQPIFQEMVEHQRLYLGDRKDTRLAHETWRALVHVPAPYYHAETITAATCDVLNAADPPIQAEGIGDEDLEAARGVERLLEHTLRRNRWQGKLLDGLVRDAVVLGSSFGKVVWEESTTKVELNPTDGEKLRFAKAVLQGELATNTRAPTDPAKFHAWRDAVNAKLPGLMIPEIPTERMADVSLFTGVRIGRVRPFDLRVDPLEQELSEQPRIIHRMLKSKKWVADQAVAGLFDLEAVRSALDSVGENELSKWDQQIAQMLGLQASTIQEPGRENMCELFEVWQPGDPYAQYLVILNRLAIINLPPFSAPFEDGRAPFFDLCNIPISGYLFGQSELKPPRRLFHELNTHRELGLDAALLAVLPTFQKLQAAGLVDKQRFLKPGAIIDVGVPNGISPITKPSPELAANGATMDSLLRQIEESMATPPQMRGAASTVGRVSATETEQRFSQSMVRHKQRVLRFEESLTAMVSMVLSRWSQFGDDEIVLNVAGRELVRLPKERFNDLIEADFRFRGASKHLNRDMLVQQMLMFDRQFADILLPPERRLLARAVWDQMGLKRGDSVVSGVGTLEIKQQQEAQQAAAAQEQMAQQEQPEAPQTVEDPGTIQAIAEEMGEAPPPQQEAPA